MTTIDEADGWERRVSAVIGQEVRRYRKAVGASVQILADGCTAVGHPVPRNVIVNMESGRREKTPVTDVMVIAYVLGVPPALLVFPIGRSEWFEVLPDAVMSPWDAHRWFGGEGSWRPLFGKFARPDTADPDDQSLPGTYGPDDPGGGPAGTNGRRWYFQPDLPVASIRDWYYERGADTWDERRTPIRLFADHARADAQWANAPAQSVGQNGEPDWEMAETLRAQAANHLREVRREISRRGLGLPVVNSGLAKSLGEDGSQS